jgi:hypothetical protein
MREITIVWGRLAMNDEQFQLLCRIDDELIQLCKWLNESRDLPVRRG